MVEGEGRLPPSCLVREVVVVEKHRGDGADDPSDGIGPWAPAVVQEDQADRPDQETLDRREAPDDRGGHGADEDRPAERHSVEEHDGRGQGEEHEIPGHLKAPERVSRLDEGQGQDRHRAVVEPWRRRTIAACAPR